MTQSRTPVAELLPQIATIVEQQHWTDPTTGQTVPCLSGLWRVRMVFDLPNVPFVLALKTLPSLN